MFTISPEKYNDLNTIMSKIFRKDPKWDMYKGKPYISSMAFVCLL